MVKKVSLGKKIDRFMRTYQKWFFSGRERQKFISGLPKGTKIKKTIIKSTTPISRGLKYFQVRYTLPNPKKRRKRK